MRAVSPSAGLSLRVMPLLDLYSNVSTSFETPTTSELSNQESGAGGLNPTLEPQRMRSVEAGINGRVVGMGHQWVHREQAGESEDAPPVSTP